MSSSGLGVTVELGPCRVVRDDKGKFTTYTLNFRIAEETHSFTSRYAKLYKFHESLLKNEEFQQSFAYNPPDFPPKSWFTDYSKPKNYRKRASKILKYFKILTSRPSILRNKQFQRGIDLPVNLQKLIKQIARGLQSKLFIEENYNKKLMHSPRSPSNSNSPASNEKYSNSKLKIQEQLIANHEKDSSHKPKPILSFQQQQKLISYDKDKAGLYQKMLTANDKNMDSESGSDSLDALLKELEIKTDETFIDIVDGLEIEIREAILIEDKVVNNMHLFYIEDILPNHLMANANMNGKCNMDLFELMDQRDIDSIDQVTDSIRDAIICACDISHA